MSTTLYPVVLTWDDLIDETKEAARKGGFRIVDFGFEHAFGTHHEYGAEYVGPNAIQMVVLNHEDDVPEPWMIKHTEGGCDGEHRGKCKPVCNEYEAELQFTVTDTEPVLNDSLLVTVEIEQV